MKKLRTMGLIVMLLSLLGFSLHAQTYTVLVGDIPGIDSLVTMISTMGEDMGLTFNIQKVPMQRMVTMIAAKQADFGAPAIQFKDKNAIANLPYIQSTAVVQQMSFILYTNKTKPIDIDNLKKGNSKGYKIESDIANANRFNFSTLPSTNPFASLKKVNDGLIDGYILGSSPGDDILKANAAALKGVKRQLWEIFDIGFALQKDGNAAEVDKILNEGLEKMKKSGKLEKIMADVLKSGVYEDWQP